MLDSADVFLERKASKRPPPPVVHVLKAMFVMPCVKLRTRPWMKMAVHWTLGYQVHCSMVLAGVCLSGLPRRIPVLKGTRLVILQSLRS